jgi:hypothetical protein
MHALSRRPWVVSSAAPFYQEVPNIHACEWLAAWRGYIAARHCSACLHGLQVMMTTFARTSTGTSVTCGCALETCKLGCMPL